MKFIILVEATKDSGPSSKGWRLRKLEAERKK